MAIIQRMLLQKDLLLYEWKHPSVLRDAWRCRNYIVQSDLRPFLSKSKTKAAFNFLDGNSSGRVGQTELLSSVAQIFK